MILFLAIKSAGIALGTFLGVSIGLFARRRRGGDEQWLLGGSIILTACVAAVGALLVAMVANYLIGVA